MGHVAHIDGAVADRLDRQIVEMVDDFGAVVEPEIILILPDLGRTGRNDLVLRRQRRAHIAGRQIVRLQGGRIQVDLDLSHLAAIGRRNCRALYGSEPGPDEVLAEIVDLLFG